MNGKGYSGTPLPKKLGIKDGAEICALNAPDDYLELISPLPEAVRFAVSPSASTDLVHIFTTERNELCKILQSLRSRLKPSGMIWVSWPKRSSKAQTDVTEDVIREVALPMGFVDIKVCSVDETWSGLKLVIRKELR